VGLRILLSPFMVWILLQAELKKLPLGKRIINDLKRLMQKY
jgi:hypothetical protein